MNLPAEAGIQEGCGKGSTGPLLDPWIPASAGRTLTDYGAFRGTMTISAEAFTGSE